MTGINFCQAIFDAARLHPDRPALTVPAPNHGRPQTLTYRQFMQAVAHQQHCLQSQGLSTGDRILLLARPGFKLYVLMIAMLGLGIVPVMIERGMPRQKLRAVLQQSGLKGVLGERSVLRFWPLFPALWSLPRWSLDSTSWGLKKWASNEATTGISTASCLPLPDDAHGIITFTSGSTGLPKGADRSHASLIAQHLAIRSHWPDQDTDIDMPSFPVLVLHNLCCGIQTVLPNTDLAFPRNVQASQVLPQIIAKHITRLTGSPAYIQGLTDYAAKRQWAYNDVRSVVIGGATLNRTQAIRCRQVFPRAEILIVYGSTEAEPIAEVSLEEWLTKWSEQPGHLVGKPASVAQVRIVSLDADLIDEQAVDSATLKPGQEGEVLVAGNHVLKQYVDNPQATAENKIPRTDGLVWHRTGDTAIQDEQGRLWLTGRVKDRLQVNGQAVSPYPIEKALDEVAGITRSAVIDHQGKPVLVLQGSPSDPAEALGILGRFGLQKALVCNVKSMPVDARHNSKLDRPTMRSSLAKGRLKPRAISTSWQNAT